MEHPEWQNLTSPISVESRVEKICYKLHLHVVKSAWIYLWQLQTTPTPDFSCEVWLKHHHAVLPLTDIGSIYFLSLQYLPLVPWVPWQFWANLFVKVISLQEGFEGKSINCMEFSWMGTSSPIEWLLAVASRTLEVGLEENQNLKLQCTRCLRTWIIQVFNSDPFYPISGVCFNTYQRMLDLQSHQIEPPWHIWSETLNAEAHNKLKGLGRMAIGIIR